jgi:hypothetical protein
MRGHNLLSDMMIDCEDKYALDLIFELSVSLGASNDIYGRSVMSTDSLSHYSVICLESELEDNLTFALSQWSVLDHNMDEQKQINLRNPPGTCHPSMSILYKPKVVDLYIKSKA